MKKITFYQITSCRYNNLTKEVVKAITEGSSVLPAEDKVAYYRGYKEAKEAFSKTDNHLSKVGDKYNLNISSLSKIETEVEEGDINTDVSLIATWYNCKEDYCKVGHLSKR